MGSWDTRESTGLLDDADVYIEKCRFGYDAQYGDALIFILEGRSPQGNPEDEYAVRQFYSIGKGWTPSGNGKTVTNDEDKEDFHSSSAYAHFFTAVLGLGNDVAKLVKARGFPDDATIWEGLAFHMERQNIDYGGEIGKKKLLLPINFLGEDEFPGGEAKATPSAAAKAKAAKAKAKAKKGGGDKLRSQLVALAGESEDHDAFLAAAYGQFPDIEDSEYFSDIIEETGEIWTEANG